MQSPGLETLLRPQAALLRLLWGAMTFAVLLYGALSYLMTQSATGELADPGMLPLVLLVMGVVMGLSSLVIPRFFPSDATLRQVVATEPDPAVLAVNPRNGRPDPARAAAVATLTSAERRMLAAAPLASTQFIVRIALAESPAIMGFVLVMLTREPWRYVPLGAFSLLLMVLARPRLEAFLERVSALRA